MFIIKKKLLLFLFILISSGICRAQFIDNFDNKEITGWFFFTGDGDATMDFIQKDGYAQILVDATKDKHNVWWAIIKNDVSASLDLVKFKDPSYELRVEARVHVSNAPRRINFMINTQRTTNFHEHLMEFDIPDTSGWYTISMTTKNLDVVPGDTLYVQMGVTDWGPGRYYVDLDYYRADVINVNIAGPDKGEPLPYHPPVADLSTFSNHLNVTQDALINSNYPDVNFNNWFVDENEGHAQVLTVNANQWAILRWDLEQFKNAKADGPGILEFTTQSVAKGGDYISFYGEDLGVEFGKIRIIEIFGGDPFWDQHKVTYNNFLQDSDLTEVFNTQMIFDLELSEKNGSKSYITISRPVMQRLLDGKTKGLVLRPLGAIDASVYDSENLKGDGPKLHFNNK
ncbi:MAG: hypothetical protein JXJ22_04130 [Bacteroidales bacterium]|nr:hypothetical protein [Bacteroidales bacterium]